MSPEDQKAWEQLEMAKEIDFDRMLQIARKRDMVCLSISVPVLGLTLSYRSFFLLTALGIYPL